MPFGAVSAIFAEDKIITLLDSEPFVIRYLFIYVISNSLCQTMHNGNMLLYNCTNEMRTALLKWDGIAFREVLVPLNKWRELLLLKSLYVRLFTYEVRSWAIVKCIILFSVNFLESKNFCHFWRNKGQTSRRIYRPWTPAISGASQVRCRPLGDREG